MPWFHGSPLRLATLSSGSTVTQDRDIARVFSHRPTLVGRDDDGRLSHNGRLDGYLYEVLGVSEDDLYRHPETTMDPGAEWLTRRELDLRLIGPTAPAAEELLSEDEERRLWDGQTDGSG